MVLAGSRDGPDRYDSGQDLEVKVSREVGFKVGQIDHGRSYSIYFSDLYGHLLEITTHDHDIVASSFLLEE